MYYDYFYVKEQHDFNVLVYFCRIINLIKIKGNNSLLNYTSS